MRNNLTSNVAFLPSVLTPFEIDYHSALQDHITLLSYYMKKSRENSLRVAIGLNNARILTFTPWSYDEDSVMTPPLFLSLRE